MAPTIGIDFDVCNEKENVFVTPSGRKLRDKKIKNTRASFIHMRYYSVPVRKRGRYSESIQTVRSNQIEYSTQLEGNDYLNKRDQGSTASKKRKKKEKAVLEEYAVERIMAKMKFDRMWKYLIKWENYHPSLCTWERTSYVNEPTDGGRSLIQSFVKRTKFNEAVRQYLPISNGADKWKPTDFTKGNVYKSHTSAWELHEIEVKWQNLTDHLVGSDVFIENWTGDGAKPDNFVYSLEVLRSEKVIAILNKLPFPPNQCYCSCANGCGVKRRKGDRTEENMCCFERLSEGAHYINGLLTHEDLQGGGDVIECTEECQCDKEKCSQRVVQRGRQVSVCVFRDVDEKGWSLRAADPIKKGQFVIEYTGELITADEAVEFGRNVTYQWQFFERVDGKNNFVLDAGNVGNEARFINHSCEPNLVSKDIIFDKYGVYACKIAFFAIRNIQPGEELTFDYLPNSENSGRKNGGGKCLCGSERCRGNIP